MSPHPHPRELTAHNVWPFEECNINDIILYILLYIFMPLKTTFEIGRQIYGDQK
jgi:hypothetical protein